jgi:nucleoside-diphosphate-sugar epimerase
MPVSPGPLVHPDAVERWLRRLSPPVAITGGTGFVGSHLVDTLCAAGLRPRVLVRDAASPRWIDAAPADLVVGSLEDSASLRRLVAGAGTVFHLAGVVTADGADGFIRANRDGTARLVEEVVSAAPAARLVHVSSLAAVGPSADPHGVGPDATPAPVSDYGRSKLGGERAVAALGRRCWWTIVRPPAIYGPRDTDVFEFFRMADRGVALLPAGERWITVAHVADVVEGLLAAACGDSGRIYHLGEPEPRRLDRMLRELAAAGDRTVRLVPVPVPVVAAVGAISGVLRRTGLVESALTRDKARELSARHWASRTAGSLSSLGVSPPMSLPEGARETWAWYRREGWLG